MSLGKFGDGIDWDEHAQHQKGAGPHRDDDLLARFSEHIPPGSKVIDLGCNIGRFCPMFVEAGYVYLGVDQSDVALSIAEERNPGCSFQLCWLGRLPYEEDFAAAVCNAVLQHNDYAAQSRIVRAAFKALKAGGVLFAAESTVRTPTRTQRTQRGWAHLFESAGFEVLETWHPNPEYQLDDHYLLRKPGPDLWSAAGTSAEPTEPAEGEEVETSAEPVEVRIRSLDELKVGDILYGRLAISSMAGRSCTARHVNNDSVMVTHSPDGRVGTLRLSTLKKSWCKHA